MKWGLGNPVMKLENPRLGCEQTTFDDWHKGSISFPTNGRVLFSSPYCNDGHFNLRWGQVSTLEEYILPR